MGLGTGDKYPVFARRQHLVCQDEDAVLFVRPGRSKADGTDPDGRWLASLAGERLEIVCEVPQVGF